MDGVDLSNHADAATRAKIIEIANHEGCSPDQVAAAALRFYVRLPEPARWAWRQFETEGGTQIDEAAWAAGRALVDRQYDAVIEAIRLRGGSPLPPDASEQDIIDYAVEICRRR